MAPYAILVIEDDCAIRQGIVDALAYVGYASSEAGDGNTGLELALAGDYDLLLLDLILPGRDGLEILEQVRHSQLSQPIIILTARGEESERVRGLQSGADDYVVKPFGIKELLARIAAVLRRSPERPATVRSLSIPEGTVDLSRCEIEFTDGSRIALSERETELLRYLASHAGRTISRDEILTRLWRCDPSGVTTRTIDMHISRLREKLRDSPGNPTILRTIRGKGYLLDRQRE